MSSKRELALVSIEMLLYRFVPNISQDSSLVNASKTSGGHGAKPLWTAWVLHGVNANSEGSVPDVTFGSQG